MSSRSDSASLAGGPARLAQLAERPVAEPDGGDDAERRDQQQPRCAAAECRPAAARRRTASRISGSRTPGPAAAEPDERQRLERVRARRHRDDRAQPEVPTRGADRHQHATAGVRVDEQVDVRRRPTARRAGGTAARRSSGGSASGPACSSHQSARIARSVQATIDPPSLVLDDDAVLVRVADEHEVAAGSGRPAAVRRRRRPGPSTWLTLRRPSACRWSARGWPGCPPRRRAGYGCGRSAGTSPSSSSSRSAAGLSGRRSAQTTLPVGRARPAELLADPIHDEHAAAVLRHRAASRSCGGALLSSATATTQPPLSRFSARDIPPRACRTLFETSSLVTRAARRSTCSCAPSIAWVTSRRASRALLGSGRSGQCRRARRSAARRPAPPAPSSAAPRPRRAVRTDTAPGRPTVARSGHRGGRTRARIAPRARHARSGLEHWPR